MGCLRVDPPPQGWGLVCLLLVLMDSKSQGPPTKTGAPLCKFHPLVFGHVWWLCLSVFPMSQLWHIWEASDFAITIYFFPFFPPSTLLSVLWPGPASCWCAVLCHYVHFPNCYFPKLSIHLFMSSAFHAIIDATLSLDIIKRARAWHT